MRRLIIVTLVLACSGCEPQDHCRSLLPGRSTADLPLTPYNFRSQGAVFDRSFSNSVQNGPPEYRCCFAQRSGEQFSGCVAGLDCTDFHAEAFSVGRPYSDSVHLGAFFCHVAVKDGVVVSTWGQYND